MKKNVANTKHQTLNTKEDTVTLPTALPLFAQPPNAPTTTQVVIIVVALVVFIHQC